MKKIGLLLFATMLLLASCADKNAFTLTGKVTDTNLDGKEVYIQELNEEGTGFNRIDTAVIEKGKFVFKGIAGETPVVRFVEINKDGASAPYIFILEKGNIGITIDTVSTVKGTPENDAYQEFNNKIQVINNKAKELGVTYNTLEEKGEMTAEKEAELNDQMREYMKEISVLLFDYIKPRMTTSIGEFFFTNLGNSLEEDQLRELLALATPEFRNTEKIQRLGEQLNILENCAIGKQFIDVRGKTPAGKEIALSDYVGKGKVVLIDFWASWCGPCRQEMPKLVDAYNKFKGKGFEIVGISLDEDAAAWKQGIKDLKITWPQMSDLKGWNSELSAPYAVRSIPHTVLIDKDGKIVAKDLHGKELLSKLEELLKK